MEYECKASSCSIFWYILFDLTKARKKEYQDSMNAYEVALKYAKEIEDDPAVKAISKALSDIHSMMKNSEIPKPNSASLKISVKN